MPTYVPQAVFTTERYDGTNGTAPNDMTYAIPVAPGSTVTVNLFMANGWVGTDLPGERKFDVYLEGVLELDEFDLTATYGHLVGGMETFTITDDGDGMITIVFEHGTGPQNPLINAIEATEPVVPDGVVVEKWVVGDAVVRINAGGPIVPATYGGIDWAQDETGTNHTYLTDAGSNNASTGLAVTSDGSVPGYVNSDIWATERWSSSGFGYTVPVTSGSTMYVNLFMGNSYSGTSATGQRLFDVAIEGTLVEDDLDLSDAYGHLNGHFFQYLTTDTNNDEIGRAHV